MSTDEDPSRILKHLGYNGDWVSRTDEGSKSDGDPDCCIEEDASERQVNFVFLVQYGGQVRLREDCKRCIFK